MNGSVVLRPSTQSLGEPRNLPSYALTQVGRSHECQSLLDLFAVAEKDDREKGLWYG